jgi:uncharacterized SAM-binding protein YcdF (DUF218 family)
LWVAAVVWLLCIPLAGPLLIRVDELSAKADAIIVIGGDHKPERVKRAAELYKTGYAPIVIISAGTQVAEGTELIPEAEVMRRQALALGLPENVLLVEEQSQSTFQNAYYTKLLCVNRGFKSIILVTSVYHSRRAGRIFDDVYGSDIAVQVQPALFGQCTLCWVFRPDQFKVVLYEYYNWGRYWLDIELPVAVPPNQRVEPIWPTGAQSRGFGGSPGLVGEPGSRYSAGQTAHAGR